jgi:hypothetical protein
MYARIRAQEGLPGPFGGVDGRDDTINGPNGPGRR